MYLAGLVTGLAALRAGISPASLCDLLGSTALEARAVRALSRA